MCGERGGFVLPAVSGSPSNAQQVKHTETLKARALENRRSQAHVHHIMLHVDIASLQKMLLRTTDTSPLALKSVIELMLNEGTGELTLHISRLASCSKVPLSRVQFLESLAFCLRNAISSCSFPAPPRTLETFP
jgi:hypothetical protein